MTRGPEGRGEACHQFPAFAKPTTAAAPPQRLATVARQPAFAHFPARTVNRGAMRGISPAGEGLMPY